MRTWDEERISKGRKLSYDIIREIVDANVNMAEVGVASFMGYSLEEDSASKNVWAVTVKELPNLGSLDIDDAIEAILRKILKEGYKEARISLEEIG